MERIPYVAFTLAGQRIVGTGNLDGDILDCPKLGKGQRFYIWPQFLVTSNSKPKGSDMSVARIIGAFIPLMLLGLMLFTGARPGILTWTGSGLFAIAMLGYNYYRSRRSSLPKADIKGIDTDEGPVANPVALANPENEVLLAYDDQLPIDPNPPEFDDDGEYVWQYEEAWEAKRFIEQKKTTNFAVWITKIMDVRHVSIEWMYPWLMGGLFLAIIAMGIFGLVTK